jgi:hypothetical protein
LLQLQHVTNMNETQNGCGHLDVWLIWMKLRLNATELYSDRGRILDILEKMCQVKQIMEHKNLISK